MLATSDAAIMTRLSRARTAIRKLLVEPSGRPLEQAR
ncbi:MAG: hypothetical protein ABIR52_11490 [Casimicrobiaceae bacterium]